MAPRALKKGGEVVRGLRTSEVVKLNLTRVERLAFNNIRKDESLTIRICSGDNESQAARSLE